jgi:transposase
MLSPTPDQVLLHPVEVCQHCRADLRHVPSLHVERRQVVDLPPKRVVVIEQQAQQKSCPSCQQISTAAFPQNVRAPVQYGAALAAVGVYLVQQQLLPYERACEVIEDLLGPSMSVGTLQGLVDRCAQQLQPMEQQIKAALSQAPVLHQDETGLYVAGQRQWMHVSSTERLTHYAVHPKRGKEALDAIGILADFQGVSMHDGWSSYWQFLCQHALCNVHHLRELIFLHEEQQQIWAGEMKKLLLDIKAAVAQARTQGRTSLPPLEVADWKARYRALLAQGYQANPPPEPPAAGKKGRRKQSKARNLLDRLSKHQDAVLRFLDNFLVPFDNSLAERDIRMVKVQQKISGCFRSAAGALAFCRIRGYLSTLRKQGLAVLAALEQVLLGHPLSPAF